MPGLRYVTIFRDGKVQALQEKVRGVVMELATPRESSLVLLGASVAAAPYLFRLSANDVLVNYLLILFYEQTTHA